MPGAVGPTGSSPPACLRLSLSHGPVFRRYPAGAPFSAWTPVRSFGKSSSPLRGRATALLVAALAFASCGENDKKDVDHTVREFVKATSQRDADKYCDDLVTQAFLEQTTLTAGHRARDACNKQLRALKGVTIRLVDIRKTEVHGDRARVVAVLEARGQSRPQPLRLRKEGGHWRIAGASGH